MQSEKSSYWPLFNKRLNSGQNQDAQHSSLQTEPDLISDPPAEAKTDTETSPISHDTHATSPRQPETKKPSIKNLIFTQFPWEFLAILTSTALLISIITILCYYNHRPQPTWEHISLNSLISWLSTLSKACVLFATSEAIGQLKWLWFAQARVRPLSDLRTFDAASRGIWGGAELIWNLRARHFTVLGSLAVILSLAFDPFNQNLIHYYQKLVPDSSETAVISSNSIYDNPGLRWRNAGQQYVDPDLKSNVYNSLFSTDASKPWSIPKHTCSTNNCTWDPIALLEFESICKDITSDLIFNNCTSSKPNCTYALPLWTSPSKLSINFLWNTTYGTIFAVQPLETISDTGYSPFHSIQMIAPEHLIQGAPFTPSTKFEAMECVLKPIIRVSQSNITRGVYHDSTLGKWQNGTSTAYTQPNGYKDNGFWLEPPSSWPWTKKLITDPDKRFEIAMDSVDAIDNLITTIFSGKAIIDKVAGVYFTTYPADPHAGIPTLYAATDLLQAIAYKNITGCEFDNVRALGCAMENAASALSKSMRDSGPTRNISMDYSVKMTQGRALGATTYVVIYWGWICLPVLVWGLGVVLIVGTVWKCAISGVDVPVWKNDVLPLVFLYNGDRGMSSGETVLTEDYTSKVRLYYEDGGRIVLG